MPTLTVIDSERLNLAALFMRGLLVRRAADSAYASAFSALKGCVGIEAGGMSVVLRERPDGISLASGSSPDTQAVVTGDLAALLALCRGGSVVEAWLSGAVRTRGNPLRLLPLLRLLRAPAKPR